MKKRPLILIGASLERKGHEFGDTSLSLSNRYPEAILAAGGLPLTASFSDDPSAISAMVAESDGVLLTGGDDVRPEVYQKEKVSEKLRRTLSPALPERDLLDLLLVEQIFDQRKPVLAICRGQQLMNVAFGGNLMLDIRSARPQAINHQRSDQKFNLIHQIEVAPGSLLEKITGEDKLRVNSTHHQAVDQLAEIFASSAVSPDGIVEAMELTPRASGMLPWFLAVQFHPERLYDRYPVFLELFRSFVGACRRGDS